MQDYQVATNAEKQERIQKEVALYLWKSNFLDVIFASTLTGALPKIYSGSMEKRKEEQSCRDLLEKSVRKSCGEVLLRSEMSKKSILKEMFEASVGK